MGNAAWFWSRMAGRYARTPVANEEAYQHKLAITRDYLPPGAQVFEFGCGTGATAIAHAPHVARILAIDAADQMIAIARRRMTEAGLVHVSFDEGDIAGYEAGVASWDAVLGLNILHLLDDWRGAIARAHQLLKPGGVLVTSTACLAAGPWQFRALAALLKALPMLPAVRVLGREELLAAMRDAGFAIEYEWQPGPREALFVVARKTPA